MDFNIKSYLKSHVSKGIYRMIYFNIKGPTTRALETELSEKDLESVR